MKIPHLLLVAIVFFGLACGPLCAQESRGQIRADGNHLLEQCGALINIADSQSPNQASQIEWEKFSWCDGYLMATHDQLVTVKAELSLLALAGLKFTGPDRLREAAVRQIDPVCIPGEVTILQTARVVVKWLREHPERLHEPQSILVIEALKGAFPCKDQQSGDGQVVLPKNGAKDSEPHKPQ